MVDISIIIPNYNHSPFLKQRIETVLCQSYQNFELIILDDNSTDDSRLVIENYRHHSKVSHIVYNETNSGSTFKQWNKGIHLAKGKYIWLAESDDYASPDFLERMVQVFQLNEGLGIAYCQSFRVNERSEIIGDWLPHTNDLDGQKWTSSFVGSGAEMVTDYLGYKNIIPNASGALFLKEGYAAIGGADETFILNGDWMLYLKILSHGYNLAYVADKLNYFREHSVKVTRGAVLKGYNILEVFRILKFLTALPAFGEADKARFKKFYFQHYLLQLFRPTVPDAVKRKTIFLAFSIAPVRTLRALKYNLQKS